MNLRCVNQFKELTQHGRIPQRQPPKAFGVGARAGLAPKSPAAAGRFRASGRIFHEISGLPNNTNF